MPIAFWLHLDPVVQEPFKKIVNDWNASHPQDTVELKTDFKRYQDPSLAVIELPDQERPCLVLSPEYLTGAMIGELQAGRVKPISEILDQKVLDSVAKIVRLTFGDDQGNLLSFPWNPSCPMGYWNMTQLKAIHEEIPETMEDLQRICLKLKNEGLPHAWTTAWFAAYLCEIPAAQGDHPLAPPDNGRGNGKAQYQFAQPWFVEHVRNLKKQVEDGLYLHNPDNNAAMDQFVEGKAIFLGQGSTHCERLKGRINSFEMQYAPLPTMVKGIDSQDKKALPLGGASIWVLNSAATQQMLSSVKAFLEHLSSIETQAYWHGITRYVPVLEELPHRMEKEYAENPLFEVVADQTIRGKIGKYNLGIKNQNYPEVRVKLQNVLNELLDPAFPADEVEKRLKAFDLECNSLPG